MGTYKRLGALTIGQSPRVDLTAQFQHLMPDNYELLEAGALDNLTIEELPDPSQAAYPLVTRLRNGTAVRVDEAFLLPHLQQALEWLEQQGVVATLLLCAGTFADLRGERPLFKPFQVACHTLNALGVRQIGVVCPVKEQQTAIERRWEAAKFRAIVETAPLEAVNNDLWGQIPVDCIVLDYVGHSTSQLLGLQERLNVPLLDLGHLSMRVLVSSL